MTDVTELVERIVIERYIYEGNYRFLVRMNYPTWSSSFNTETLAEAIKELEKRFE